MTSRHLLTILLTILAAVALCACGQSDLAPGNDDDSPSSNASDDGSPPGDAANSHDGGPDGGDPDDDAPDAEPPIDMPAAVDMGPFGGDRPAQVFTPADWSPTESYPVVVLVHGFTASGTLQNAYFRTSSLVDEMDFVLVVPDGMKNPDDNRFWNATHACCDFYDSGVDDSTYLSELAADAVERYAGDPARVYFMGHSNGGYMSYRMACDHSDQIAAIAGLAGATWLDPADCGEPDPVAVLQIHGTLDPTVPYDGRPNIHPGAEESVERWAQRNGCDTDSVFVGSANYDGHVAGDETQKYRWDDCSSPMTAELWRMEGSGHIPAVNVNITRSILEFLFRHSR